jgi:hypothetical protein
VVCTMAHVIERVAEGEEGEATVFCELHCPDTTNPTSCGGESCFVLVPPYRGCLGLSCRRYEHDTSPVFCE